ncbi:hypothetical protein ACIQC7_27735 [Kitasatospora sp. NPDC088556]|uniref:zinc finger domain-containing protein n=1 Tax=Kitasatospora sp. NPDC088556 TaxID=3364076 RepID=UPI0038039BF6
MDAVEATKLLAHAAAFDNRKPSKAASIAWAEALKDVPADADAFGAVARFYSKPSQDGDLDGTRWIQPHHVRQLRRQIRDDRIPDGAFTYPLPTGSETGAQFIDRRRQQIAAIADGRIEADPIRQLKGGPHPSVADALAGVGCMPDHVREALADALPGRRAREEGRLRGDADALAVPCPWCHADTNNACKRRRGARGDRPGTWFHRTSPHPGRVDAAAIAARPCPGCQAPMGVPCASSDGRFYDGVHPARQTTRPAA